MIVIEHEALFAKSLLHDAISGDAGSSEVRDDCLRAAFRQALVVVIAAVRIGVSFDRDPQVGALLQRGDHAIERVAPGLRQRCTG